MTLRAFIAGYYGAGNAGDEWILSRPLAGLRRRDPATEARVPSYDPEAPAWCTRGREVQRLADGDHCMSCSRYAPAVWTEGGAAESRKPTDVHR